MVQRSHPSRHLDLSVLLNGLGNSWQVSEKLLEACGRSWEVTGRSWDFGYGVGWGIYLGYFGDISGDIWGISWDILEIYWGYLGNN